MIYDKIWSEEQQHLIQHYITGATEERNRTYERLYPTLNNYIEIITKQLNKQPNEDLKQHIHYRLYQYTLNKLTIERKETIKDLIFIAIRNTIYDYFKRNPNNSTEIEEYHTEPQEAKYTEIEEQERLNNQQTILTELDKKIEIHSTKSKRSTNVVVLMLLLIKQYLIDNNFDERECGQYLMQVLKLKRKTVVTMLGRAGIRSYLFFKPKLNDKLKKIKLKEEQKNNSKDLMKPEQYLLLNEIINNLIELEIIIKKK